MKRRAALLMLFAGVAATAKPLGMQSSRSGSPPPPSGPSDAPGPSGSASFTVNWGQLDAGADGLVVYYGTSSTFSDNSAGYPYRKVFSGGSLTSGTVSGIASGAYYCRVAGYVGTTVGDLSQEIAKTAA